MTQLGLSNREIKFRAWDNVKNEMYYTGDEDLIVFMFTSFGIIADEIIPDDSIEGFHAEKLEHLQYMQFTGLLDKNGVEIYEGDVIELHQFLFDGCGEVEKELTGEVIYQKETCSFALNRVNNQNIKEYMGYTRDEEIDPLPIFLFHGLHEESFTVIGNIYDHPHLLEGS